MSDPLDNNSSFGRYTNDVSDGGVPVETIDDTITTFFLGALCLFVWMVFSNHRKRK